MKITTYIMLGVFTFAGLSTAFAQDRQLAQPVLMAIPASVAGQDALTLMETDANVQAAATAINQVLVERRLEVRDLKQQVAVTDRLRSTMNSVGADQNALIAASVGADVYLEYTIVVNNGRAGSSVRVDINVKEAATAKMLGASSGVSGTYATSDIGSLCQMAVNNGIERVMGQIRAYWSEVPTRGKPILVAISSSTMEINKPTPGGKRIDREVTRLLKRNTISYRKDYGTSNTMLFNPVYVDAFEYDDVTEFGWLIEDLMTEIGVRFSLEVTGKSVELTLE